MAKLTQISENGYTRAAYAEATQQELDFRPGVRVIPAIHANEDRRFVFIRKHEVNTPSWKNGGYECREVNREDQWFPKFRAFELDALIVHHDSFYTTID